VAQSPARLKEAAKLGFRRAVAPETGRAEAPDAGFSVTELGSLAALVAGIAANSRRSQAA
jgi:DNA repair protein RadA/Sms